MSGLSSVFRLKKGSLIAVDKYNPLSSTVIFQYNPATMSRSLEARAAGGGDKNEALRLSGPPKETITISIELDAMEQLNASNPVTASMGIYPTLSVLELMLYPSSESVMNNNALALSGSIEILPTEAPMLLFSWGINRILPVRISSFSITEEAYDPGLNPIQAKVDLSLTVMSYVDFGVMHPGSSLFMAHQQSKELMARFNGASNVQNIISGVFS